MARGHRMICASVAVCMLLSLCRADGNSCNISTDGDQTTYSIPEWSGDVAPKAARCTFTWSNASNIVIATHRGSIDPVLNSSFGKLVTSRCIGSVVFAGNCALEWGAKDYLADCTATCSETAQRVDKGEVPSWIPVVCVMCFLVVGMCFLCYKYKALRKCICGQTGGFYVFLKKNEDVEEGKV